MRETIEHIIYYQIEKTTRAARQFTQKIFDQNDITITKDQFVLMRTIHDFGPISQVELANKALKETASITRMLDLLEKQGMTQRTSIENDRRRYNIELTTKGQELMDIHLPMLLSIRAKGIEGVSETDLDIAMKVLKKIQSNFSD